MPTPKPNMYPYVLTLHIIGIRKGCERFESAKARTGSPLGTVVQIQKGANEDHTLKSLEFVSQSLYVKAKSLKTQHLKWLRKCADQFCMVQDIALVSARCGNAAG